MCTKKDATYWVEYISESVFARVLGIIVLIIGSAWLSLWIISISFSGIELEMRLAVAILAFIGVLATFVVVSNYAQVATFRKEFGVFRDFMKSSDGAIKELQKEKGQAKEYIESEKINSLALISAVMCEMYNNLSLADEKHDYFSKAVLSCANAIYNAQLINKQEITNSVIQIVNNIDVSKETIILEDKVKAMEILKSVPNQEKINGLADLIKKIDTVKTRERKQKT